MKNSEKLSEHRKSLKSRRIRAFRASGVFRTCYIGSSEVQNSRIFGPGITLNGAEAVADFEVKDAIVCPVEGEDIVYNFVSEQSKVYFRGKTGKYTLFVRIYDNNTGNDNDRWVVLSAE